MDISHNKSFIENKTRLAEIHKLGKQLEAETDPEKKEALKKEITKKGDSLKASLCINPSDDAE